MASSGAAMDFDEILMEIGEFGRYQRVNYVLICLPVLFAAANSLSYVFTAGIPKYRCHIEECDEADQPQYQTDWLDDAMPGTRDKHGSFTPRDVCMRYAPNSSTNSLQLWEHSESQCNPFQFLPEQTQRCQQFVYEIGEHTIVQEWQLTCKENTWKLAFVGTTHFAGLVIGTALFGYLADRYGRKYVFLFCTIFMGLTGIGQAFAWDYISFLIFALLNAVGTSGVYPLAFIIGVEMVGPRKREMTSIVLNYFYAVGEALVGLAAWLLTDWKHLQLALSIPPLFFVIYFWLVPESVRWLLARNEHEKAGVIIRKAAHVNQRELSLELMACFKQQNLNSTDNQHLCSDQEQRQIWASVKQVFGSHSLIWRYSILLIIWAVNAIVFYGLSLNSTNLSGNKYLNFALVCLIEIPGYSLAWVCLRKFGRRLALSSSLLLCSVTCAASGYMTLGPNWLIITLFLLGKLGITSSFAVIYTYTAEMMPTVIRSGGVGVMSTFARFGAMLAPFVPLLGNYYEPLPLLLFGGASLLAGFLSLLLPETFHKKLPDTVADAIMLGTKAKLHTESHNNSTDRQQNETII